MAKVYVFLADGFEDVEALIPIDVLRRGGVDVVTVSTTEFPLVESAHGVNIEADIQFEQSDYADADLIMLPGGMPGASNLFEHEGVCKVRSGSGPTWCARWQESHLLSWLREGPERGRRHLYRRPSHRRWQCHHW